jgi:cellulose synthase/poly-beta-1,6-N-acetylglucosamine synthase-like glycosyltransferase
VVLDADCSISAASLDTLVRTCFATGVPAQARYGMLLVESPTLRMRVAAFAWRLRGEVRAGGASWLGLPCQLMGTGMAFPWKTIADAPLAHGHITEDLQLGIDLAIAGHAPRLCRDADVFSRFPATDEAMQSQRTRWEHGYIATMFSQTARLFAAALRQRRGDLAAMAFDLAVPPLALLVLISAAVGLANIGSTLVFGWGIAAGLMVAALLQLLLVLIVAWHCVGRDLLGLVELIRLPLFVVGKLPGYGRLLTGRLQQEWIRTDRRA